MFFVINLNFKYYIYINIKTGMFSGKNNYIILSYVFVINLDVCSIHY